MPRHLAGDLARAGLVTAALALASCGSAPLATFDLSAPRTDVKARALKGVLAITEPAAPAPADSDRIVVRTGPSAVAVVKGAQWAERLPRLLQTRLIQTFENAKLLKSVSRPGDGATPDHALAWDVRRFEVDAGDNMARVEVSVRLLDTSGKIVAAQIFSSEAPGEAGEGNMAAQALDAASNNVLRQIVAWAAGRV
jgi:cholesterol transport system auxiliary component